MRSTPLLALALVAACGDPPPETPDDTKPARVDQCTEDYVVPGAMGAARPHAVDPHQDVFAEPLENVGATPDQGQVGADPVHVHLGWPARDTSRSVSFVWTTNTGTLSSVVEIARWGDDRPGEVMRYEGVSFRFGMDDAYRVHELKLCGRLEPATTYSYRVGGEGHWSEPYTFTTPPEPGSFDTYTVVFAGDSRGAYEDWANLVALARAESPDLVLFSGDMVTVGGDQREWFAWWEATGDVFAETFLVPAHGNHEFLVTNWFAQFSLPNNEQWFSVDFGDATIVVLNDTVAALEHKSVDQVAFLDEVLGKSTARWKLVMHHSAMYSRTRNHGSAEDLREWWTPAIDEHDVDLVIAGHNHVYERSVPIRDGVEVPAGEGAVYLVSGGAGAPLYTGIEEAWFGAVAEAELHYVVAQFGPDGIALTTKALSGRVIDSFEIPAGD